MVLSSSVKKKIGGGEGIGPDVRGEGNKRDPGA